MQDDLKNIGQLPVLFDETGEEKIVGWYKNSSGKRKPVYEKSFVWQFTSSTSSLYDLNVSVEHFITIKGFIISTSEGWEQPVILVDDVFSSFGKFVGYNNTANSTRRNKVQIVTKSSGSSWSGLPLYVLVQYTKTTDVWE